MKLVELARRYYQSYETGDRSFVEQVMAEGFTFTSPSTIISDMTNISRAAGRTMSAIANSISKR